MSHNDIAKALMLQEAAEFAYHSEHNNDDAKKYALEALQFAHGHEDIQNQLYVLLCGIISSEDQYPDDAVISNKYEYYISKLEATPCHLMRCGYYYTDLGKFEKAMSCVDRFGMENNLLASGEIYLLCGKYQKALDVLLLSKASQECDNLNIIRYVLLASACYNLKRYREAKQYFDIALELGWNYINDPYYKYLIWTHVVLRDPEGIKKYINESNVNFYFCIAMTYIGRDNDRYDYYMALYDAQN